MLSEREKLNQQDLVDNAINEMIEILTPSEKKLPYNGNVINDIRCVLIQYFVEELHLCTEEDFYPYMDEDDEDEEEG